MEIRFILLISLMFVVLPAKTYAAKQEMNHNGSGHYSNAFSISGGDEDRKEVKSSKFEDDLKELTKGHNDDPKFVKLGNKHGEHENEHVTHYDGDDDIDDHGINTIPVPAAVWLFGSALLGLIGAKRKKA